MIDRNLLEKRFTKSEIKQRKGNFGATIDYIPTQLVIQRLNDAFAHTWSFKVVEHTILENEVVVLGELYTSGIYKQQFGSNKITKSKQGEIVSIGDDLKSATSDSLKKCASMMGVALHIYGDSLPAEAITQKTEWINTSNGLVELPLDNDPLPEFPQGKKMDFTIQDKIPPSPPDKPRLQRMKEAYFAAIQDIIKDDNLRHTWQKNNIGKWSTKEWSEADFEKALDLVDILRKEQEENSIDEDEKKEVPELDATLYENNGGGKPATSTQLRYIQKLLDIKGYYIKGDTERWTVGKASVLINFLTEQ